MKQLLSVALLLLYQKGNYSKTDMYKEGVELRTSFDFKTFDFCLNYNKSFFKTYECSDNIILEQLEMFINDLRILHKIVNKQTRNTLKCRKEKTRKLKSRNKLTNKELNNQTIKEKTQTNKIVYGWLNISYSHYGINENLLKDMNLDEKHVSSEFKFNYAYNSIQNTLSFCDIKLKVIGFLDNMLIYMNETEKSKLFLDLKEKSTRDFILSINYKGKNPLCPRKINDCFKFDFFNMILTLENRFCIKFVKLFSQHAKLNQRTMNFLFREDAKEEERECFVHFFQKLFTCSSTLSYLKKCSSIEILSLNKKMNLRLLISEFTKFQLYYLETIKGFFEVSLDTFMHSNYNFFRKEINDIKKRVKAWCVDLFRNETNMLIVLLIPEIKILFQFIQNVKHIQIYYKKIVYIITIIVLKFSTNLPFIKYEFFLNSANKNFKINDSKILNCLILEIRMLLSLFATLNKFRTVDQKIFLFKAFLSFVTLKHKEQSTWCLINEYVDMTNCKEIKKLVTSKIFQIDVHKQKMKKMNVVKKFKGIKFLNSKLFKENNKFSEEKIKINRFYSLLKEDFSQDNNFQPDETGLVEKITKILKEALNK